MVSTVQTKPPSLKASRSHPCVECCHHQPMPNLDYVSGFVTHLTFFFPSNLLLRAAIVRPAGSGGGGGASGARARTRVTDGVSGDGIDGRPRVPDMPVRADAVFLSLSRRRGVPNTSDLVVETEGRTDVTSWVGLAAVASGIPFRLGSSSASISTSWSESMISLEVDTPPLALAFFLDLVGFGFEFDLDLSSAFRESSVESGRFFGDIPILYSGWWSDTIQRRRPRCTPMSPATSSFG